MTRFHPSGRPAAVLGFHPSGRPAAVLEVVVEGYPPFEVASGTTLLEACEGHGVPMASACGGFAACNSCRVDVLEGADALSELVPEEEPFLDREGQRLGCQARVVGSIRVRLAPGA